MDFLKKVHETVEKGGKVCFSLVLCTDFQTLCMFHKWSYNVVSSLLIDVVKRVKDSFNFFRRF